MKIALNVGCGDKLIKSTETTLIINIDAVAPADLDSVMCVDGIVTEEILSVLKTRIPDKPLFIQDDVTRLTWVDSGIVDELHSYHVLEHFHAYEVEGVLKTWHRVLKNGGVLILELPDVLKCAINLLQISTTQDGLIAFDKGLMGIYGAQDPSAPLMAHKFGWTFKTLAPVLRLAGFSEIGEFKAQTHWKTERDFRIEGVKRVNE